MFEPSKFEHIKITKQWFKNFVDSQGITKKTLVLEVIPMEEKEYNLFINELSIYLSNNIFDVDDAEVNFVGGLNA